MEESQEAKTLTQKIKEREEQEKLIKKKAKISISFSNIHTQDHWKSFQLKNNLW